MSGRHPAIERSGNFVDLFDDAAPPTADDVSVTITGERLDTEEKIRAFAGMGDPGRLGTD